jgi:formylglycine-generating enzyme required for sulfatase activity/energy-coupling factor transporter ATP-binding protein EcfA2
MRKKSLGRKSVWTGWAALLILVLLPLSGIGQQGQQKGAQPGGFDWTAHMGWIIAGLMFLWVVIQYILKKRETRRVAKARLEAEDEFKQKKQLSQARTLEGRYRAALEKELGTMGILGSPDIESIPVKLDDAFVSLRISETWRSDKRFDPLERQGEIPGLPGGAAERYLSPEQVMNQAFKRFRLLLIVGDPGSGKTTLLKYYAVCCLKEKHRRLGFDREILPVYFPLRELAFTNGMPASLPECLSTWSKKRLLDISAPEFQAWLHRRPTLVLLDGLDEIGDLELRQKACEWIKDTHTGLKKAYFVVTSRWTGYRKSDLIELECQHLRADVMDFSAQQQEEFLQKWFKAAFLRELPDEDMPAAAWRDRQEKKALGKALAVIGFLNREESKSLRELAAVPMLLQIMAVIWKHREFLPGNRPALYDAALNYLLDYRDRRRKLDPLLPAEKARTVLAPAALWMQADLKKDEVSKEALHRQMDEALRNTDERPGAEPFCANLRDRAGLIADYGQDHYIFRHKSFREFLAALELVKETHKSDDRLKALIDRFNEDWWEESLRFFISKADGDVFDRFVSLFFQAAVSGELNANKQTLLQDLVREAPHKKIDGLVASLNRADLDPNRRRYILDCLKTVDRPDAFQAVRDTDKGAWDRANRDRAEDIVAEAVGREARLAKGLLVPDRGPGFPEAEIKFRNPFEDNVEYILIPGGSYHYSVTGKEITVPDMYFCKYPVTNKRYRRFISYLAGDEKELTGVLPHDIFVKKMKKFARSQKGFLKYSGRRATKWPDRFRSRYDEDKRFRGEDQPVVAITWYAVRAYCFWLSSLEAARRGDLEDLTIDQIASLYRLPTEWEWQWAAAGREPDGSLRKYPWPKNKGEPTPELANYGRQVGTTTPVGRYPEGATPEGLMDMAGNAWEWMENFYREDKDWRSLRGGSWFFDESLLRCSARLYVGPLFWNCDVGFRVVRCQLPGLR